MTEPAGRSSITRRPERLVPYVIPIGPKQLREALAVAQTAIGNFYPADHEYQRHRAVLGELIAECDRLRPTKPDGKHDGPSERCTTHCGCAS